MGLHAQACIKTRLTNSGVRKTHCRQPSASHSLSQPLPQPAIPSASHSLGSQGCSGYSQLCHCTEIGGGESELSIYDSPSTVPATGVPGSRSKMQQNYSRATNITLILPVTDSIPIREYPRPIARPARNSRPRTPRRTSWNHWILQSRD